MPTVSFTQSEGAYVGSSSGTINYNTWVNLTSNKSASGASDPKGTGITYAFNAPSDVNWASTKFNSMSFSGIQTRNNSSSVKDSSWGLCTGYGAQWNSHIVLYNDVRLWRYHGISSLDGDIWLNGDKGAKTWTVPIRRGAGTFYDMCLDWAQTR